MSSGPCSTRQAVWCELYPDSRPAMAAPAAAARSGSVHTATASWKSEHASPAGEVPRLSTASELDLPPLSTVGPDVALPPPAFDVLVSKSSVFRGELRGAVAHCAPRVDVRGAFFMASQLEIRRVLYGSRDAGGAAPPGARGDTFRALRAVGGAAADVRLAHFSAGCTSFELLGGDVGGSAGECVVRCARRHCGQQGETRFLVVVCGSSQ
jgi:hypothetical protein